MSKHSSAPTSDVGEQRLDARRAAPGAGAATSTRSSQSTVGQSECLAHASIPSARCGPGGQCAHSLQLLCLAADRQRANARRPIRDGGPAHAASSRSSSSSGRVRARGEVLVRVRFSGVNPTDVGARERPHLRRRRRARRARPRRRRRDRRRRRRRAGGAGRRARLAATSRSGAAPREPRRSASRCPRAQAVALPDGRVARARRGPRDPGAHRAPLPVRRRPDRRRAVLVAGRRRRGRPRRDRAGPLRRRARRRDRQLAREGARSRAPPAPSWSSTTARATPVERGARVGAGRRRPRGRGRDRRQRRASTPS